MTREIAIITITEAGNNGRSVLRVEGGEGKARRFQKYVMEERKEEEAGTRKRIFQDGGVANR